ncbi:MAG: hypothetical protein AB7N24_20215 [Dehalococcoidia bacterium]
MTDAVYYLPLATTVFSVFFTVAIFRRWDQRDRPPHLLWWGAGVALFGVGTFFEGFTALFGWHELVFRGWYISGALLGGAPLAQGTVYLLLSKRTADRMGIALVLYVAVAAAFVLLTPVDASIASDKKLSGEVIEWTWVRAFSPLVNTYAFIFLVGGAVASVARYGRSGDRPRAIANCLIAVGAILPGIGGSFTRAGYTEVLYVTELMGIILIFAGFRMSTRTTAAEHRVAPSRRPDAIPAP